MIKVLLFGVFINTVYVIILGLSTGKRVFGFSGLCYVDFVGIGALMLGIILLYSKGYKQILIGILFLLFITGLLLTQTRNAWFSFGLSFISLLVFLMFKGKNYFVERKKIIIYTFATLTVVMILYFSVSAVSTGLEERLNEKGQTALITSEDLSVGSNSLVSRALIWHTAYNAFIKHPIIGIGAYSFPFTSQYYYKIPKELYNEYVIHLTPHVTFFAVLTETGILGMAGFLILLFSIYKLVFKNIRAIQKPETVKLFLMINWVFIYIIISMFMTDAWLWGQQIVILGMFLGFLLIQNRINFEN